MKPKQKRANIMKPQELYLDYFNNFLTIKGFADYYAMTEAEAQEAIERGRTIHEAQFSEHHEVEKYEDGSHGWFKVSKYLLSKLDISDKITDFSYMKGNYAYLEEDCDATTFFNAFEKAYPHIQIRVKYIDCEYNRTHNPRGFEDYRFMPVLKSELQLA